MRRFLYLFSLALLTAALGASGATAQSSTTAVVDRENSAQERAAQERAAQERAGSRRTGPAAAGSREDAGLTRMEIRNTMLGKAKTGEAAGLPSKTLDIPAPSPQLPQQESESNRRIYYIVGGALVATGLVVGILALDDGGGGGQNIPAPPGGSGGSRPPQP
jgi:hypothetical protein